MIEIIDFLNIDEDYDKLDKSLQEKEDWVDKEYPDSPSSTRNKYWRILRNKVYPKENFFHKDVVDFTQDEVFSVIKPIADLQERSGALVIINKYREFKLKLDGNKSSFKRFSITEFKIWSSDSEAEELILKLGYLSIDSFYTMIDTLNDCSDVERLIIALARYGVPVKFISKIKLEDLNIQSEILNVLDKTNTIINYVVDKKFINLVSKAQLCDSRKYKNCRLVKYLNEESYLIKHQENSSNEKMCDNTIYSRVREIRENNDEDDKIRFPYLNYLRLLDMMYDKYYLDGEVTNKDCEAILEKFGKSSKTASYLRLARLFTKISGIEVGRGQNTIQDKSNREPKKPLIDGPNGKEYPRDKEVVKSALESASYECEFDSEHKYFINSTTNENYVEGHHLLPLKYHEDVSFHIDTQSNVASLCPVCHRLLHHGIYEVKEPIIRKLYKEHKSSLNQSGLDIGLPRLLEMYKEE